MRNIFLDTNIALDIICQREPYYEQARCLLEQVKEGEAQFFLASASLANLLYFTFDFYRLPDAGKSLTDFMQTCALVHTEKETLEKAAASAFTDKEDALQYYTALSGPDMDYFITRNTKDYLQSSLPVLTPEQFIARLQ